MKSDLESVKTATLDAMEAANIPDPGISVPDLGEQEGWYDLELTSGGEEYAALWVDEKTGKATVVRLCWTPGSHSDPPDMMETEVAEDVPLVDAIPQAVLLSYQKWLPELTCRNLGLLPAWD